MSYPSKTDIVNSVCCPQLIKDIFLQGTFFKIGFNGQPVKWGGGYSLVFQFVKNEQKWAFRVWHTEIEDIRERYKRISTTLAKFGLPYFDLFTYVENGLIVNGQWIDTYRMRWIDGQTLNEFINLNINNPKKLLEVAEKFKEMVWTFHKNNIAHGDLQHGNIMVKDDGSLMVIDYDSMYLDTLHGMADIIKGQKGYQHPARDFNKIANPKLDYFSESVIYLSLLAYSDDSSLWENDTDRLLFSIEDLNTPHTSKTFKKLISSANPKIYKLADKLFKCLRLNDILLLKPLEEMLADEWEDDAKGISDKF